MRLADLAGHTRQMVPQRTHDRQHPILNFHQADNFVVAYYAGGEMMPKAMPFTSTPEIEPEPGTFNHLSSPTYYAYQEGDGNIVQGNDNTIIGPGGMYVGGNIGGSIFTGHGHVFHSGRSTSFASLPANLAGLRDKLIDSFNKSEIRSLCFDLGILYDDLPGETRTELAEDLIAYCHARGRLPDLLQICQKQRIHVSWTID